MPLVFKALGSVATDPIASGTYEDSLPVTSGLLLWSLLGKDGPSSAKNYAPGGADGSVIGAPSYTAYSALLTNASYINTGINETADFTLFGVMRRAILSATLIGNFSGSSNPYALLGIRGTNKKFFGGANWNGGSTIMESGGDANDVSQDFEFIAITANVAALEMRLYRPASGEVVVTPTVGARGASTGPLFVGRSPSTFNNPTEIAAVGALNFAAEIGMINAIRGHLRNVLANRGCRVV